MGACGALVGEFVGVLLERQRYVCALPAVAEKLFDGSLKIIGTVGHERAGVFDDRAFLGGEELVDLRGLAVGDGVAEYGVARGHFQAAFCLECVYFS